MTHNIDATGIDAIESLIDTARKTHAGAFYTYSYREVRQGSLNQKYDMVVCNFSLLGKQSVIDIFCSTPNLLNPKGTLVIQTLHPACFKHYKSGWHDSS